MNANHKLTLNSSKSFVVSIFIRYRFFEFLCACKMVFLYYFSPIMKKQIDLLRTSKNKKQEVKFAAWFFPFSASRSIKIDYFCKIKPCAINFKIINNVIKYLPFVNHSAIGIFHAYNRHYIYLDKIVLTFHRKLFRIANRMKSIV